MVGEDIVLQRRELLFPENVFGRLVYENPETARIDLLTYFCPIPATEIREILQRQDQVTERDYTRFKLAKRSLMKEVYQSVASLFFAIINTDGVRNLRRSKATLEQLLGEDHPDIIREVSEIVAEADTTIDFLAQYPVDGQASRRISDLCGRYDTIIREQVQPILLTTGKSRETIHLYTKYGANHHHVEYTTFDDLLRYVGAGGYGRTHQQGGMDPQQEESWDRFHLRIRTNSGVLFNLKATPNSFSVVDPFYNFDRNSKLKYALQPIELDVSSAVPVVYASLLEEMQARLRTKFEFKEVTVGNRKILIYCPDRKLIADA